MQSLIKIPVQGKILTAELHAPASGSARGGVVMVYGSEGLTDTLSGPWASMIREHAAELVELGYMAIIPDYLGFTSTPPGLLALAMLLVHRRSWELAISAALQYLRSHSQIAGDKLAFVGFSLGGHLCLRLRAQVNCLVSFYAPVLDDVGRSASHLIAQLHHGDADAVPAVKVSNLYKIHRILLMEGAKVEPFVYEGAGHGFVGDDASNKAARQLSADRMYGFLRNYLDVDN